MDKCAAALKCFYQQVTHLTSLHLSLAKASHMSMPNFKETGKGITTIHTARKETELVVISTNHIH